MKWGVARIVPESFVVANIAGIIAVVPPGISQQVFIHEAIVGRFERLRCTGDIVRWTCRCCFRHIRADVIKSDDVGALLEMCFPVFRGTLIIRIGKLRSLLGILAGKVYRPVGNGTIVSTIHSISHKINLITDINLRSRHSLGTALNVSPRGVIHLGNTDIKCCRSTNLHLPIIFPCWIIFPEHDLSGLNRCRCGREITSHNLMCVIRREDMMLHEIVHGIEPVITHRIIGQADGDRGVVVLHTKHRMFIVFHGTLVLDLSQGCIHTAVRNDLGRPDMEDISHAQCRLMGKG